MKSRTCAQVPAWLALGFAGAVVALLGGCDHESSPPPPVDADHPTFDNIWPSADSTAWTFTLTEHTWPSDSVSVYPDEESVPPAPGLDEVAAMLSAPVPGNARASEAIFRLRFEGMITTASGAHGQNLVSRLYNRDEQARPPSGRSRPDRFLERLAQVRPDLRDRIGTLLPARGLADPSGLPFEPVFLHGYAWARTADWIGNYGDLDTLLSWKYLGRTLAPGTEFVHQLMPGLADNVFLHARIVGERTCHTEAGTFENCLECLYLLDYGVMFVTDESGVENGWYRAVDVGRIVYAPGVGPV